MASGDKISEEKTVSTAQNTEEDKMLPREKMVSTAVHFLINPKVVKEGSVHQKKAFLQSKGLTEEEIALAFERANVVDNSAVSPAYFPAVQVPPHHQTPSTWMRVHQFGSSIIIITIACYGVYRIYKLYIEPWLFGEQNKEDKLTEMEHQLVELNRSLSHLRRSVGIIEDNLASQKTQLSKLCEEAIPSAEFVQNPLIFSDIKSEIASIKSLLLGRQRFPPAPNVAPMIPSWQLQSSPLEKKNEEEDSCEKENASDPKEVEESLTSGPISNSLEDNSVSEESSKTTAHEAMNSVGNEQSGDLVTSEVQT